MAMDDKRIAEFRELWRTTQTGYLNAKNMHAIVDALPECLDEIERQAREIKELRLDCADWREEHALVERQRGEYYEAARVWEEKCRRQAREIERLRKALESLSESATELVGSLDATRNPGPRRAQVTRAGTKLDNLTCGEWDLVAQEELLDAIDAARAVLCRQ